MRQLVDGRVRDMYAPRVAMSPEQAEARRLAAAAATPTHTVRFSTWSTVWPDCGQCGQSCTGVYGGKISCIRCTSNRRLNG